MHSTTQSIGTDGSVVTCHTLIDGGKKITWTEIGDNVIDVRKVDYITDNVETVSQAKRILDLEEENKMLLEQYRVMRQFYQSQLADKLEYLFKK